MSKYPAYDQAERFAKQIIAGKIPSCKYVKLACQRHFDDLESSKKKDYPYKFDKAEAQRRIDFIELLPHTKGEWAFKRQLLTLEPWQKFGIAMTFGWKENPMECAALESRTGKLTVKTENPRLPPALGFPASFRIGNSVPKFIPVQPLRNKRGKFSAQLD